MSARLSALALLLSTATLFAEGEAGWCNISPGREFPTPVKTLWNAPISKGIDAFSVEWRDGATGKVSVVEQDGTAAIEIAKRNGLGCVVVKPRCRIKVPPKTRLRTAAGCESADADCEYAYGFLAVWSGEEEDLTYHSVSPFGRGGPKMTQIANTSPGMPDRKLAHGEVGTNGIVSAAIVVAGAPSVSRWMKWTIEDFAAASENWKEKVRNRRPPAKTGSPEMSDAEFDALVAKSADHTAKVEKRDGGSTARVCP